MEGRCAFCGRVGDLRLYKGSWCCVDCIAEREGRKVRKTPGDLLDLFVSIPVPFCGYGIFDLYGFFAALIGAIVLSKISIKVTRNCYLAILVKIGFMIFYFKFLK